MMKKYAGFLIPLFLTLNGFSQTVIVGTGVAISAFSPFTRAHNYCAYEAIYLANEINLAGNITRVAFDRVDGTNTDPIDSVTIYMQQTVQTSMSNGPLTTAGYQLVYEGPFPNDAGAGWREVVLPTPFSYDGINNLQILAIKGYQPAVANTPVSPRWHYTNMGGIDMARRDWDSIPIVNMTATDFRSNVRLEFGMVGVVEIGNRNLQVYPNPAENELRVVFPAGNGQLDILNFMGETVISTDFDEMKNLKIESLANGVYLLRLIANAGKLVQTETFIKK